jgi:Flp pilus assembly protein TadG
MPAAAAVEARMMWAMRFARFRPAPTSRRRRRRQHGQGMVEFALVAPVFFFTIFAMIDGGFLLFSVNAVDQATTIGTNSIAGLGKLSTADITAMQRMAASPGLKSTSLITISEIDVEELVTNLTGDGFTTHSDGTPIVATGCTGGPTGVDGTLECVNEYAFVGSGTSPTINVINGTCTSAVDPSQCPPWPPSTRNVYNGQSSFVGLKVSYSYKFFTGVGGTFNLTTTKTFRLEPQNAPGS